MACCKNVSGPTGGSEGTPGGDRGDDRPRQFTAAKKGKGKKVLAKKRKASDQEAEVAHIVAATAEGAEVGGRLGSLWIGSELTTAQRRAVLQVEQQHGSPPGTIMLGEHQVRIDVRELAQEEPETQEETEAQPKEQPLRRSTRARTQAASRPATQSQSSPLTSSSTPARSTPAPALARIHKDYTRVSTREVQELRFAPFPTWFPPTRDQQDHARFYTMV